MAEREKEAYLYTPLFCEENIWQLARALVTEGVVVEAMRVLIFTNHHKQVLLLNQQRSGDTGYVVWDYHVVLRVTEGEDRIYDFDTQLPFPCASYDYLADTFPPQTDLPEQLRCEIREVPAQSYLRDFYSDRHHMVGAVPEEAFPPWPTITPRHPEVIRLEQYWDVDAELSDGSRVMGLKGYMDSELP